MNSTVAIVGTAGSTRDLAPYQNNNVDIWMFNSQALAEWVKRVDTIIEMHKPETIVAPPYLNWLKNTKIPVYMQDKYDFAPTAVKFPFEEIRDKYLSHFFRGLNSTQTQVALISYFTSSVCYAIALAIFKGYKRIEMYGIDMANNTEYIYQRDGIALWFGIALGLGIEVYIPRECAMFDSPRYGYDDKVALVDREEFERVASELQPLVEEAYGALKQSDGVVNAILVEMEDMKKKGVTNLDDIGSRYSDAMNRNMQCIADYAAMAAQYRLARQFQTKVEKQMEAAGNAQEVIALKKEWKPT